MLESSELWQKWSHEWESQVERPDFPDIRILWGGIYYFSMEVRDEQIRVTENS